MLHNSINKQIKWVIVQRVTLICVVDNIDCTLDQIRRQGVVNKSVGCSVAGGGNCRNDCGTRQWSLK